MRISKLLLATFVIFISITTNTNAGVTRSPGQTAILDYNASNVTSCLGNQVVAPSGYTSIPVTISSGGFSGSSIITAGATIGVNTFTLTCNNIIKSDTLNVVAAVCPGSPALDITQYPSCTCPVGQVQSGTLCIDNTVITKDIIVTVPTPITCTMWGVTYNLNNQITAYSSSASVNCSAISQTLTCTDGGGFGVWSPNSASYPYQSCSTMSGTISANSCTIPANGSSCNTTVSWSTTNPIGTSAVTHNRSGLNLSGNNGTNQTVTLAGSISHTLYLYNSAYLLDAVSITPPCATGSGWDGTLCLPAPAVSMKVNGSASTWVDYNSRATLSWASSGATSCTAGGSWSNAGTLSGSGLTDPLTSTQSFSLSCTNGGGVAGSASATVNVCPASTPFYIGGTCINMSGALSLVPASCTIAINETTCTSKATWTSTGATAPKLIDKNVNSTLSTLANQSSPGMTVWVAYPQTTFEFKNDSVTAPMIFDTKTVTSSCASGSSWDGPMNKCKAFPPDSTISISGNRTANGTINVSCTNAKSWSVVRTEGGFSQSGNTTSYASFSTSITVTQSGNYTATCTGHDTSDSATVLYLNYPPLPANMTINAMPKTTDAGSVSAITWSVTNPAAICNLIASPVCTSGTCSADRNTDASTINTKLQTGHTDSDDKNNSPGTTRTIMDALRKLAPYGEPTGTKAVGKATIPLKYTTDFMIDCGSGTQWEPLKPSKVRVNIGNDTQG